MIKTNRKKINAINHSSYHKKCKFLVDSQGMYSFLRASCPPNEGLYMSSCNSSYSDIFAFQLQTADNATHGTIKKFHYLSVKVYRLKCDLCILTRCLLCAGNMPSFLPIGHGHWPTITNQTADVYCAAGQEASH